MYHCRPDVCRLAILCGSYYRLPCSPAPGAEATEANTSKLFPAVMGANPNDEPEKTDWRDYLFYAVVIALFLFAIITGT